GIPALQKRVRKVFSIADKTRAIKIARTEVISSANKATLEAYRQSGVVKGKRWLTAGDDRVRDSHKIDGQKVKLDEMFTLLSGVSTDGPGQSGVGAEDILCRCTTTAITKK
ncbi:MAG: phage minor head protein, partial [Nitrosopumilus sp.]